MDHQVQIGQYDSHDLELYSSIIRTHPQQTICAGSGRRFCSRRAFDDKSRVRPSDPMLSARLSPSQFH
jgi:hypothetical protein